MNIWCDLRDPEDNASETPKTMQHNTTQPMYELLQEHYVYTNVEVFTSSCAGPKNKGTKCCIIRFKTIHVMNRRGYIDMSITASDVWCSDSISLKNLTASSMHN